MVRFRAMAIHFGMTASRHTGFEDWLVRLKYVFNLNYVLAYFYSKIHVCICTNIIYQFVSCID